MRTEGPNDQAGRKIEDKVGTGYKLSWERAFLEHGSAEKIAVCARDPNK
jgi:hypothetical protein